MLWNTFHVNQALGINDQVTIQVYTETREALIKLVQNPFVI